MDEVKLLPCPFCNQPGKLEGDEHIGFFAGCTSCFCEVGEAYDRDAMPEHIFRTENDAINAWNTRPTIVTDEVVGPSLGASPDGERATHERGQSLLSPPTVSIPNADTGCPPHCCCCDYYEPCCDCGEIMPSRACIGERCWCGSPAAKKVGEEILFDDPHQHRHNLTAYVCARHYAQLMGPLGAKQVGFAASAIEARRAETPSGSVADERAVPKGDAHD